jgi:hypothetical protein
MTGDGEAGGGLPLVQYWHSPEVPAEIAELTATFCDRNPRLRHLLFSEAAAAEFIAEHHGERELAAFRSCAVPAMQADYFRYCAMLTLGGVYADADLRCLRPLAPLIETVDGGLLFRREMSGNVINDFFVIRPPAHPLLRLTLDVASANIERRTSESIPAVTGPWIFSGLLALHRLGSFDALRRDVTGLGMNPLIETICDAVAEYGRVAAAFEGVRVERFETAMSWIAKTGTDLPHKRGETHWINWQKRGASIYR